MRVEASLITSLQRKVSRQIELETGQRVSRHRVHRSKKAYDRKRDKRVLNLD
jgi:hypothetical protein